MSWRLVVEFVSLQFWVLLGSLNKYLLTSDFILFILFGEAAWSVGSGTRIIKYVKNLAKKEENIPGTENCRSQERTQREIFW